MKRNGFLYYSLTLMVCVSSSQSRAGEIYNFYNGVRGLGMGGTQVPTVNDETALLINPAALGKLRDDYLTVVDGEVEGNALSVQTLSEGHGTGALTDPQELNSALQSHLDHHYHAKAQTFPSFVLPNFGVGIFGIETQDANIDSQSALMHVDLRRDVGVALGYNFRFWDGRIKVGAAARLFDRMEINTDVPQVSSALSYDTLASDGGAVAVDASLILADPIRFLPQISAVVHDVGGTEFSLGSGGLFYNTTTQPQSVSQSIDVGAAIFPILSNHIRMAIGGEFRDVMTANAAEQAATYRRVHLGAEINFADTFFMRAGLNQKYWTAGFELSFRFMQMQIASYGEDIGAPGTPQEDRRYVLKLAFRY